MQRQWTTKSKGERETEWGARGRERDVETEKGRKKGRQNFYAPRVPFFRTLSVPLTLEVLKILWYLVVASLQMAASDSCLWYSCACAVPDQLNRAGPCNQ